jgi:NTE family protein
VKKVLILSGGGARGAFQIGGWQYLVEKNWKPDIICGTSVGAINAASIGSGMDVSKLVELWTTSNRRKMYRLNLIPFLAYFLSSKAVKPLLDTKLLQSILVKYLDFNALQKAAIKVIISAINVQTAIPHFFKNKEITLEHVLTSSAMSILFPWHKINGIPFWDGGIMANVPLIPVLDFGSHETIVVHLSPVGHTPQAFPKRTNRAGDHVLEQFLAASYQDTPLPLVQKSYRYKYNNKRESTVLPQIITLSPSKMLGFKSMLSFLLEQAKNLIDEGYKTAHT